LRKFELDIYLDPAGGLYANPLGLKMSSRAAKYDSVDMNVPGLKVMHVQDLDFRTHCQLFQTCLNTITDWSALHPRHIPIVILINAKDAEIQQPGFVHPRKFNAAAWHIVDDELRTALGVNLFTPDDLRGSKTSLPDAIKDGWPLLDSLRGKILVVLDQSGEKLASYIKGHNALKGRAMFANAPEGTPEAAIRVVNDPIEKFDQIQLLVKSGYLVRTRADADTKEARSGSTERRDKAFASGAQIISTDYYVDDPRFEAYYKVSLPGQAIAVCNPVLVEEPCQIDEF
jgi:hypothetical protein